MKPSGATTQTITYHIFKVGPAPPLSPCPPSLCFFGLGSWASFSLLPGATPIFTLGLNLEKIILPPLPPSLWLQSPPDTPSQVSFPSLTSFQPFFSAWGNRCTSWVHTLQPCPGISRHENMQPGLLPDPVKLFLRSHPLMACGCLPLLSPVAGRAGSLVEAMSADQAPRPCGEGRAENGCGGTGRRSNPRIATVPVSKGGSQCLPL